MRRSFVVTRSAAWAISISTRPLLKKNPDFQKCSFEFVSSSVENIVWVCRWKPWGNLAIKSLFFLAGGNNRQFVIRGLFCHRHSVVGAHCAEKAKTTNHVGTSKIPTPSSQFATDDSSLSFSLRKQKRCWPSLKNSSVRVVICFDRGGYHAPVNVVS